MQVHQVILNSQLCTLLCNDVCIFLFTHRDGLDDSAYQVMSAKDKVTLINENSTTD